MTYHVPAVLAAPPLAMPPPSNVSAKIIAVAEALQPSLTAGQPVDTGLLRTEMERAFGGSDAAGAWDWKLAYEAGEAALVLFLRKFGRALLARAGSPAALLPILTRVSALLPTHTRRSEEMERFQQFSTTLPMGLAALAAGVDKTWGSCGAFSVCDGQPTIENCGPCDGYSVSPFGRPPHPSALSHAGIGNVID